MDLSQSLVVVEACFSVGFLVPCICGHSFPLGVLEGDMAGPLVQLGILQMIPVVLTVFSSVPHDEIGEIREVH